MLEEGNSWVRMQAAPGSREAWWRLGRCRLELENYSGALGPLLHTLRGWPSHPANAPAWRALMQVCSSLLCQIMHSMCQPLFMPIVRSAWAMSSTAEFR